MPTPVVNETTKYQRTRMIITRLYNFHFRVFSPTFPLFQLFLHCILNFIPTQFASLYLPPYLTRFTPDQVKSKTDKTRQGQICPSLDHHGVAKSRIRLSVFTFTFHFHALEKEMATHSVSLPGESQGWGSLVCYHLWGRTESDRIDVTQRQ